MPTIKDVAQASGFSVCTVSKALSGKGSLRDETRKRILEVVDEIGYHPNRLAVSLKTGRTNTLALIVPDVTNTYFPRLEQYVEKYASQRGYMVILCNAANSYEREKKFMTELSRGRVDGVIVVPSTPRHEHIMKLGESGIPYVYVNRYFEDDIDRCILANNEEGGYECVSYLLDAGFTRIGAVFQSFQNISYAERYQGMERAFKERGLRIDKSLIAFDVDDLEHAQKKIERILKRPKPPQAVFAGNDMLALNVYQLAYGAGMRLPDDLSVVGYDDSILADKLYPRLTSYYQPAKESARVAIDRIMSELNGESMEPIPVLRGHLVERGSVDLGKKSAAAAAN